MNDFRKLMEDFEKVQPMDVQEAATPEQWEIAINNLIKEGDARYDHYKEEAWAWARSHLLAMLDYQPEGDDDWKHERTEPELDKQTDFDAPPRDDGYGDEY